jgi:uncharacterized repeat protein (TIGR03943 family)
MKPEARAILLVLLGAALMHLALFGDGYLRYVRPVMRPYLVVSSVLLVLVGLVQAFLAVRALLRGGRDASGEGPGAGEHAGAGDHAGDGHHALDDGHDGHGGHDEHDEHGGHRHRLRAAWLLLLPVVTVFLVAPPALGSFTAQRAAESVAKPVDTGFPALPAGNPLPLPLADFVVRAVWDTKGSLKNRPVQLIGFAVPRAGGGWYLTRLTITCCAADAVTYKVRIRGTAVPKKDEWFKVTGVWRPDGRAGRPDDIPVLNATRVTGIAEPHDPYE